MLTMLIVDDEKLSRVYLKMLISQNFPEVTQVVEAENAQQALQSFEELLPDGVIMDIRLPGASGIEVARQIMEKYPFARILICSAYDSFSLVSDALEIGVCGYILKPMNREDAVSRIRALLWPRETLVRHMANERLLSCLVAGKLDADSLAVAEREYGPLRSGVLFLLGGADVQTRGRVALALRCALCPTAICGEIEERCVGILPHKGEAWRDECAKQLAAAAQESPGLSCAVELVTDGNWAERYAALKSRLRQEAAKAGGARGIGDRLVDYLSGLGPDCLPTLSLDTLAQDLGITSQHLSSIFKEKIGVNFLEYATRLRMDYACTLLRRGDMSIRDISEKCGYADIIYFKKLFQKTFGVSPREYAQKR